MAQRKKNGTPSCILLGSPHKVHNGHFILIILELCDRKVIQQLTYLIIQTLNKRLKVFLGTMQEPTKKQNTFVVEQRELWLPETDLSCIKVDSSSGLQLTLPQLLENRKRIF